MSTWTTKDATRARNALALLNDYMREHGCVQAPPTLSASLTSELENLLGKSLDKFIIRASNISDRIIEKTLRLAADSKICAVCGFKFAFRSYCEDCRPNLSREQLSALKVQAYEQTCVEKHGRRNVFAGKVGAHIAKVGMRRRHGVDNPGQLDWMRALPASRTHEEKQAIQQKVRATNQSRLGVDHWSQVPKFMEALQDRIEAKHGKGIRNVMHTKRGRAAYEAGVAEVDWKAVYEKSSRTVEKRFGVKNIRHDTAYIQQKRLESTGCRGPWSETTKARYKKRTGFDHPQRNPEIRIKGIISGLTKKKVGSTKKISGESNALQGCEPELVSVLQKRKAIKRIFLGSTIDPIQYWGLDKDRSYFPDLILETKNGRRITVEAKSIWTLTRGFEWSVNYEKFKAAHRSTSGNFYLVLKIGKDWTRVNQPHVLMKEFSLRNNVPYGTEGTRGMFHGLSSFIKDHKLSKLL